MENTMQIILISFLVVYIYVICIVRLLSKELKFFTNWVKRYKSKVAVGIILSFICIFAPVILAVYLITNVVWKALDFLLK
jgi:hypothetical protein